MSEKIVFAGINLQAQLGHFTPDERTIIYNLSHEFYITNGGKSLKIGNSVYRYCFLKLPEAKARLFGVTGEMIVLFSPFEYFEPRSLDALEKIYAENSGYRLDKICAFVISQDESFLEKLEGTIKSNRESRVITPFTYKELLSDPKEQFYRERIKKYFFERDLFDFDSPLRKDLYFFGRESLCHSLVDKHFSAENSGVFGLRRSGKTSILFSIIRTMVARNGLASIIDCQKLHLNRWWDALFYVVSTINAEHHAKVVIDASAYAEKSAAMQFEADITKISHKLQKKILIILDEIEQITFDISFSANWKSGEDYIKFWHVMRGVFQKTENPITFIIAGTNPKCVETPFVCGGDNPLYGQIKPIYIAGFTVEQTKQMVNTLSGYMGIYFEEDIYTYLTREYGGHPFLIRQICSFITKKLRSVSQTVVDRHFYQTIAQEFNDTVGHGYCEMVVGVLSEHYMDEYTMLTLLASGNVQDFNQLAESDPTYTQHLLGYGVLEKSIAGYDFRIDALKGYLSRKNKYQRLNLTNEEKLAEISLRRNSIEPRMRKIVMQQLLAKFGEEAAKGQILAKHDITKRRKYFSLQYKELFDSNKHEIYFDDLRELMRKNWDECFRNIFSEDIEKFNSRMVILNSVGRSDAHVKNVPDHDMQSFRGAMTWLEQKVDDFLG